MSLMCKVRLSTIAVAPLKVNIGIDAESGLIHSMHTTGINGMTTHQQDTTERRLLNLMEMAKALITKFFSGFRNALSIAQILFSLPQSN